jgi:hypothetical protein
MHEYHVVRFCLKCYLFGTFSLKHTKGKNNIILMQIDHLSDLFVNIFLILLISEWVQQTDVLK